MNNSADYEFKVLYSDVERTVLEFNLKNYRQNKVLVDGREYVNYFINGAVNYLIKGYPDLPRIVKAIIIPDNGVMDLKILDIEVETHKTLPVIPSKGNLFRNVNPEDIPYEFSGIYSKDIWFPDEFVDILTPFIITQKMI